VIIEAPEKQPERCLEDGSIFLPSLLEDHLRKRADKRIFLPSYINGEIVSKEYARQPIAELPEAHSGYYSNRDGRLHQIDPSVHLISIPRPSQGQNPATKYCAPEAFSTTGRRADKRRSTKYPEK
jgi:hypothetical protein